MPTVAILSKANSPFNRELAGLGDKPPSNRGKILAELRDRPSSSEKTIPFWGLGTASKPKTTVIGAARAARACPQEGAVVEKALAVLEEASAVADVASKIFEMNF